VGGDAMKDPERVVVTLCAITAAIMITFIAFDVLHIYVMR
jgi:hypothetical protein